MTILTLSVISNDRAAKLESLDLEAAQYLVGGLKERFTVLNPNGGVRTEVREIIVENARISSVEL
jgi:hypothetical protein